MAAFHDRLAMLARRVELQARAVRGRAFRVEGARKQASCGRLADPADAGQHESVRDAVQLERIAERSHHGFLTDEVGEKFGAVFACQHLIGLLLGLGRAGLFFPEHGEGLVVAFGFGFVSHR